MPFLLILIVVGLIVGYLVFIYNALAKMLVRIDEATSQIDVQLKRRVDLIPNLIETVKGYAAHEKEVFQKVTEARTSVMNASTTREAAKADETLSGTLKSLFAVAESYPELKANENFMQLQDELVNTEDKVAYARQFLNTNVKNYNEKIAVFPSNIVASAFGFAPEEYLEISDSDREPVKVSF
jgi:LemA protein